ncbi:MAG: VirB8/TrbF family protein [Rhodanobacter sp.]
MLGKKSSTQKIDGAITQSINYEMTIADIAKRSERRAWWVATSAIVMALILACGYFYMLPLKEKVPYLVMADAYTGTSTVARLTDSSANQQVSASEAINRSNVAHFVLARESYDVALMNLRDWTTVLTMSSPGVAAAYTAFYAPTNPDNPYKRYGRDKAIRIKILSIVLLDGGANKVPKGATVRFQRSLYDKQTGATQPLDSKIATLEFTYKPNLKMADQYRIENPLGFQVTSYRVDDDYATTPPAETQGAPLPAGNDDRYSDAQTNPPAASTQAPGESADGVLQQPNLATPPPIPEHENPQPSGSTAPAPGNPVPRNNVQGVGRR